jgi:hypothetical protein
MSDKPFLGLVVPFVPAVGWIRAYKAKEFPRDLVAIDVTRGELRGLAQSLKARDIAIVLAGLRDDVRENLTAVGAEQDLGPIPAHRTIEDCLRHGAGSSILITSLG